MVWNVRMLLVQGLLFALMWVVATPSRLVTDTVTGTQVYR